MPESTEYNRQAMMAAHIERTRAIRAIMDLFFALRSIRGQPTLKDLVKLAKRIRGAK